MFLCGAVVTAEGFPSESIVAKFLQILCPHIELTPFPLRIPTKGGVTDLCFCPSSDILCGIFLSKSMSDPAVFPYLYISFEFGTCPAFDRKPMDSQLKAPSDLFEYHKLDAKL
jgi:hypothetical protein